MWWRACDCWAASVGRAARSGQLDCVVTASEARDRVEAGVSQVFRGVWSAAARIVTRPPTRRRNVPTDVPPKSRIAFHCSLGSMRYSLVMAFATVLTVVNRGRVMKTFVMFVLVLFSASNGFAQWGDWSKPYDINNPYGSNNAPRTSRSQSSQSLGTLNGSRYDSNSLSNPYGAGSPYKTDGLNNPYSQQGSRYSNESWTNPYATNPPKIYSGGTYRGELSKNRFAPDSTSNPYGQYGSRFSPDSVNNPYGLGSPYSTQPIYVYPRGR